MGAGRRRSWPAAPVPTYRIEATTSAGMGAMEAGGLNIMHLLMGGRPTLGASRRQLDLRLDSPLVVSGPTAEHRIPAALGRGRLCR